MLKVIKVLNNNALLAKDESTNKEVVLLGKAVGFGLKINDEVQLPSDAQMYILQDKTERGESAQLISKLNPVFLEISHQLLNEARKKFREVDSAILLPLADHLAFAYERLTKKVDIHNPLVDELKLLYEEEFQCASLALTLFEQQFSITLPEDEIGYIALHLHSAVEHDRLDQSMQIAHILNEAIVQMEKECQLHVDRNSLSYSRLMTHIRYLLARIKKNEVLNLDMDHYVKTNYPYAYQMACTITERLEKLLNKEIAKCERGYLGLHVERVRQQASE
ncbi:MAG: PRD domain-containing protein [Erysipelotrichaceae bacterium]|nr:PRD domain-containing protein [Erysipelotrichaceae bacterium]